MRMQPIHPFQPAAWFLAAGLIFGLAGCGPREATPPPVSATPAAVPQEAKPEPATPSPVAEAKVTAPSAVHSAPAPGPMAAKAAPAAAPMPTPLPSAPEAKPVAPAQASNPSAPAQALSPVSDPGGEVAVKPTKAGLSRVGTSTCKMCHKVQFASWSDTAHGKRTPPLDCESCHGSGSEYKSIPVMKDLAKAKDAGLVLPGAAFCATCHKRNWNDGMLKKAHAHKA